MNPTLQPAPFGVRFGAFAIDVAVVYIIYSLGIMWLQTQFPGVLEDYQALMIEFREMGQRANPFDFLEQLNTIFGTYFACDSLIAGAVYGAFFFIPEALWGTSLGKRTLGLVILNRSSGTTKGLLTRSFLKNFNDLNYMFLVGGLILLSGSLWIGFAFMMLGMLWSVALLIFMLMATNETGLTPYDRWTGTCVYRKRDLVAGDANTL